MDGCLCMCHWFLADLFSLSLIQQLPRAAAPSFTLRTTAPTVFSRFQSTRSKNYHGAIGIDLGTTNSAVAVVEGKTPKIIENSEGM